MKCYKLTNQKQETKNNTKWNIDKWNAIKNVDASQDLCTKYWLHAYQNPHIAVLMNCRHANIDNPRLFEAEAKGEFKYDGQLKFGCTNLKIVKEIKLPRITKVQRIKIAIYCALEVYKDESFTTWARNWLSGRDRTAGSARKATAVSNTTYDGASDAAYWSATAAYDISRHDASENTYIYDYVCRSIQRAISDNPELDVISIINKVLKE